MAAQVNPVYEIKKLEIRACPKWVDDEMMNWARYCWRGAWPQPMPKRQCASLEGCYSRHGEESTTESVDEKPIPVLEVNAKIIQRAYDHMAGVHQLVLRAEYPQRREWGGKSRKAAARFVGLREEDYLSILASALYRIQKILEAQ